MGKNTYVGRYWNSSERQRSESLLRAIGLQFEFQNVERISILNMVFIYKNTKMYESYQNTFGTP